MAPLNLPDFGIIRSQTPLNPAEKLPHRQPSSPRKEEVPGRRDWPLRYIQMDTGGAVVRGFPG